VNKIGASDVIKVFERERRPLTSQEISNLIDISASCVRRILNSLNKDCSVNLKFRQLTFEEKKERYHKVVNPKGIRIYWLE